MKRFGERFLLSLLCGFLIFSMCPVSVWAAEETDEEVDYYAEAEERKSEEIQSNSIQGWPQGPAIGAEGAILMEADSGTVLYAKNIHEHLYPASITKLLTGLLAYEKLSMDDMVEFSETAVFSIEFGSSSIGIDPGEALTVEQSLYALMVASANEVAAGLAEKMGGSLDKFPDMMNSRAESLGCTDSHFTNPHGLFNEEHYTSAYDMALIAREYFSHEELAKIANSPTYFMESSILREESPDQFNDTVELFDYGFGNFQKLKITDYEKKYTINNPGFMRLGKDIYGNNSIPFTVSGDGYVCIPKEIAFDSLTSEVKYDDTKAEEAVRTSIEEAEAGSTETSSGNKVIGTIHYSVGDWPVGKTNILFTGDLSSVTMNSAEGTTGSVSGDASGEPVQYGTAHYSENKSFVDGIKYFFKGIFHSGANGTMYLDVPALLFLVIIASAVLIVVIFIFSYIRYLNNRRRRRRRRKKKKK